MDTKFTRQLMPMAIIMALSLVANAKVVQKPSVCSPNQVSADIAISNTITEYDGDGSFSTKISEYGTPATAARETRKAPAVADITLKLVSLLPGTSYAKYHIMDYDYRLDSGNIVDSVEIEVPADGCDIVVRSENKNTGVMYYLVKHIDPKETDELVFDFSEAVNFIGFRPIDPDGTELTWSYGLRGKPVIAEGNIAEGDTKTIIYNEAAGQIHSSSFLGYDQIYGENDDIYYGDLYTNLNGDEPDYVIMHLSRYDMKDNDKHYSFGAYLNGVKGLVSNDPDNFASLDPKFDHTPAFGTFDYDSENEFSVGVAYAGTYVIGDGMYDGPMSVQHCTMDNGCDKFYSVVDFARFEKDDGIGITSPGYIVKGNGDVTIAYNPLGVITGLRYDFSSPFYYTPDQALQGFGGGPAIMTMFNRMYRESDNTPYECSLTYFSTGVCGDQRNINDYTTMASASFNGEVIMSDLLPMNLNREMRTWYKNNMTAGEVDYTFVNKNYTINEVEGTVTSVMHIDQSNSDCSVPVLYGLLTKDSQNNVGYVFEGCSPDDLTVYISVLDENYNAEDGKYYSFRPADVSIEYCAHGSDSFEALPIYEFNDVPSNSYGFTYTASLKGIDMTSDNSLYDLRITTSDASGNRLTETVSPALYISSKGSGIDTVSPITSEVVNSTYYDMLGRKVENPTNGVFIQVDNLRNGETKSVKTLINN